MYVIRKRIKLPAEKAIFIFVDEVHPPSPDFAPFSLASPTQPLTTGTPPPRLLLTQVLPPTAALMSAIYEEHKDEDGFLYVRAQPFIITLRPCPRLTPLWADSTIRRSPTPGRTCSVRRACLRSSLKRSPFVSDSLPLVLLSHSIRPSHIHTLCFALFR